MNHERKEKRLIVRTCTDLYIFLVPCTDRQEYVWGYLSKLKLLKIDYVNALFRNIVQRIL